MANNKRRRARRMRRVNRALKWIAAGVLTLGLIALGITLIFDRVKPATVRSYPMEYVELIRSSAAAQELEPAYVAAVVLAESSYDPNAVSSVNAQGLMQILPSTAEWIAGSLGESYTEGCLFDPATNLRYGCWYLHFLSKRYDGDKRLSTAAYHAGQGTVDSWLQDGRYSSDGKTLEVIAGDRTNTYVNRVLEYYAQYEKMYQESGTAA